MQSLIALQIFTVDKTQSPVHHRGKSSVHPSFSSFPDARRLAVRVARNISRYGLRFDVGQFLFHLGAFRVRVYTAAIWNISYSWRARIASNVPFGVCRM